VHVLAFVLLALACSSSAAAAPRPATGYGRLMLMRRGKVLGSFAQLGHQLGYGHHDWGLT
jgi:hypothetical protein